MHTLILTSGSRGDVQPFVAMALGLMRKGCQVTLAGDISQRVVADTYGVPFSSCGMGNNPALRSKAGQAIFAKSAGNTLREKWHNIREYAALAEKIYVRYLNDAFDLCQDADLILCSGFQSYAGAAIAHRLQIPVVYLSVVPGTPTNEFQHYLFSPAPGYLPARMYNAFTHRIAIEGVWQLGCAMLNRVLARTLQASPLPRWYPQVSYRHGDRFIGGPTRGELTLYGFSEYCIPRPSDWPAHHLITGYWFLDAPAAWGPPESLLRFLHAGPPPIYIGFGSMLYDDEDPLPSMLINALRETGQRAVVCRAWSSVSAETWAGSDVCLVDDIPHQWLLPRMSAAIHHGGAGTTAAVLRAGIPSLVIPFITDQTFWGHRLHKLGVGVSPIARKHVTVRGLVSAIQQLMKDRSLRDQSRKLGSAIDAERGVDGALKVLTESRILA